MDLAHTATATCKAGAVSLPASLCLHWACDDDGISDIEILSGGGPP